MNRKVFSLIAASCVLICGCESKDSTVTGNLDIYEDFRSEFVEARTIRVWTPENYNPETRYDVIYMHDGQNLFDSTITWNQQEWGVDETVSALIAEGKIRPCIVVGIDCNDPLRYEEYYPSAILNDVPKSAIPEGFKPLGDEYLRFLIEEVKPFIDENYSTWGDVEHTFVAGSSCGGLISSYAFCEYPEIFSGAACLSTHSSLYNPYSDMKQTEAACAYVEYLKAKLPADEEHRLYMDCGDCEIDAEYAESQANINSMIESLDWDNDNYMYRFFPGKAHCERDWQERFEIPLLFLLSEN